MEWDGHDNPLRTTLGDNVKLRRRGLHMTQEVLAQECGFDRTYVSGIERGCKNPSLDVLARLAVGLRVAPWKLLLRDDPEEQGLRS